MGLKITNYELPGFGLTLPKAYARLSHINIDLDGGAYGTFEVHQTREDIGAQRPLETKSIFCVINKEQPIYTQLYNEAKKNAFINWEDDIVAES